ncbi:hypothetical protein N0V94_002808 [Neodidymelliopsis sp. IMI 364377]|nr:hypothetical protein N0V94_002808 [Neodidymelliopsis sp. IMI 364377]
MVAVREGYQDIALMLVSGNVDITNNEGDTALAIALEGKAGEPILRLIEVGAELRYLGRECALVDQSDRSLKSLVTKLLKAGADTTRVRDLENGAEVEDEEESDDYDDDALFVASRKGQTELVNLLWSYGSSAYMQNKRGQTPLLIATVYDRREIAQTLLRNALWAIEIEDIDGRSALSCAIEGQSFDSMTLLVQGGQFAGLSELLEEYFELAHANGMIVMSDFTPDRLNDSWSYVHKVLPWAATYGHVEILLLSTDGTEANAKDEDGHSLLSWAAENGDAVVVKLLLDTGNVDIDTKDREGRTPLWWAVENKHAAILNLLINSGKADVNTEDLYGQTPLQLAVLNGYMSIIKLLLDTGEVDVNKMDYSNWTPLFWAAVSGNRAIVQLLLDTKIIEVDVKDEHGWTPLWRAAGNRHVAVFNLLLDIGKAYVRTKDKTGQTLP